MDCTRVEELLALFSGDDLDARQAEAVRDHLSACPACQAWADELSDSRSWLQATPPPQFDDAFYAELRQSVLRELPPVKEEGGRFAWLADLLPQWRWEPVLAWAATVALLLVAGWVAYRNVASSPKDALQDTAKATPSPAVLPLAARKVSDLPGQSLLSYRGYAPDRSRRSPKNSRPSLPKEAAFEASREAVLVAQTDGQNTEVANHTAAPEPEMTRIEFQTADPNIRIIWLAPKVTVTNSTEPQTK